MHYTTVFNCLRTRSIGYICASLSAEYII